MVVGNRARLAPLSNLERRVYEWQMWIDGLGEESQRRLKAASVLISRCGGLGGTVALQLAAAGVGKLILAHGGKVQPSDLNRQTLMTHDWVGRLRVHCAARRLRALNPRLEVVAVAENISARNAQRLVRQADVVADCAPLFRERYALNRQSVEQSKPMVECAVCALQAHITTFVPGRSPCLVCLCPRKPPTWRRRFPVLGAVPAMVGALAAMEIIKLVTGLGEPLLGRLLTCDLRRMTFRTLSVRRDPACAVCGSRARRAQ